MDANYRNHEDQGYEHEYSAPGRSSSRNTAYYIDRWINNRGKGPRNYRRRDSLIEEDVNERLLQDPFLDAREIIVAVSHGEVILSGSVPDRWSARQAEFHASEVSGVVTVKNQLNPGLSDPDRSSSRKRDDEFQGNEDTQLASFRENLRGYHSP